MCSNSLARIIELAFIGFFFFSSAYSAWPHSLGLFDLRAIEDSTAIPLSFKLRKKKTFEQSVKQHGNTFARA